MQFTIIFADFLVLQAAGHVDVVYKKVLTPSQAA
jgi:hypothetical protein